LWKRIFKSIKAIRRKEIKTNVGKTDGFSIPLIIGISNENKTISYSIKLQMTLPIIGNYQLNYHQKNY